MATIAVAGPVSEFLQQGYAMVPFPNQERLIDPVVAGFLEFLKEPPEYLSQWVFNVGNRVDEEGRPDPDDGYIRRQGQGHDNKCFFHYRPHLSALLEKRGVAVGRHKGWLIRMQMLYDYCDRVVRKFNQQVGEQVPECGIEGLISDPRAHAMTVLRLLHYDLAGADPSHPEVIGKEHPDRDFTTMHVAESHPGLQIGPGYTPWDVRQGEALVFPGRKFERLMREHYPERNFQALTHRVVASGERGNRWSIVFFSHIPMEL